MPFLPLSFILLIGAIHKNMNEEQDFDYEEEERYLRVAIVEDKAYWVSNNILYEAEVVDEEIIKEEARPVNAFEMDFKEVTKMMTILDNIQDWKN
jgi:hypothetical protein